MALADILRSIDELKKLADTLRPIAPEKLKILNQKLRLDWNFNSNALEGNTLTLSETKMLLLHGYHTGNKLGRHYEEIELHNDVLLALEELVRKHEPMTEVLIRNLHHQLMGNDYFVSAYDSLGSVVNVKGNPGEYKNKTNGVNRIVNGREIFVPFKTPDEVRIEIPELLNWYRQEEEKAEMHPVIIAAIFHFRFVTLHPFDDGNGRMSRILMNMILMRAGFVPAIIRIDERTQYNANLALAQDGGNIEPFIELVANDTLRSLELLVKAAKGESIEEKDDLDKEIELLKRNIKRDNSQKISIENLEYRPLWAEGLVELFLTFISKLEKFNDLFENTELTFSIDKKTRFSDINQILHELRTVTEPGLYFLSYKLSSYKLYGNRFDLQQFIWVNFHDCSYEIKFSNDFNNNIIPNPLEYKYDQVMDSETIITLTNSISKGILNKIKEKSEQK